MPIARPAAMPTIATVAAPGRGYSSNARTSASSRNAIATANGASFALMKAWPTNSGQVASSASAMKPATGPPMRRPVRQTMTSPSSPTSAPASRRVSNTLNGRTFASSAAARSKPPPYS